MRLSATEIALLAAALSERSKSVIDLAQRVDVSAEDARMGFEELQRQGYLEFTDGVIGYRRPETPVTESIEQTLAEAVTAINRAGADISQSLESLPALLQAWETGEAGERAISGGTTHAAAGPGEAWMSHFARDTPATCDVCLPDLASFFDAPRETRVADWITTAMTNLHVRLVISDRDTRDAALRPAVQRLQQVGIEIRRHPSPPSFFWVSDRAITGLPAQWGEHWPTSVLTVRSAPVAEAIAAIFEQAWAAASPVADSDRGWGAILSLMNQGLTMEAAGSRLGLAPRTARRRVAAAMAHYGVTGQLALGVAWARHFGAGQ